MLIYKIENKVNGKVYIGATKAEKPNRRWIYHRRDRKRDTHLPLYKAMNKYGVDNFEFSVIHSNINTVKELSRLEVYYIKTYDTTNSYKGYNCTIGGEGFTGMLGEKNPMYGKKRPDVIERNKKRAGIKLSEEQKMAISFASKGRKHSKESIKIMSDKRKAAWSNGKYSSEEYKIKMSKAKTKQHI